ncbi:MAG: hypothetical protein R2856_03640 [Caldilineaceae bacterium]
MAKNIGQAGRPVVIFSAGIGVPSNLEGCTERRCFSVVHYLALICDDDVLAARLQQRPAWRQSSHQPFIDDQLRFNRWLKAYNPGDGQPPISLIDTSMSTPGDDGASCPELIGSAIQ